MFSTLPPNYEDKYAQLLLPEKAYTFYLKVQSDIRKVIKQQSSLSSLYSLLQFSIKHLCSLNENESSVSLLTFTIDQLSKSKKQIQNIDEFLSIFYGLCTLLPDNADKTSFKREFITFIQSQKIPESCLQKHSIYIIFCKDSLHRKNYIEAYRYALKSQDFESIHTTINTIIANNVLVVEKEKYFLITRMTFELILTKNLKLAFKFISQYVDTSNNFNNNSPVINFAYMLTSLITRALHDFDKFWALINLYKKVAEQEYYFQFYLNKISQMYYNRKILQDEPKAQNEGLFGMLKNINFGGK